MKRFIVFVVFLVISLSQSKAQKVQYSSTIDTLSIVENKIRVKYTLKVDSIVIEERIGIAYPIMLKIPKRYILGRPLGSNNVKADSIVWDGVSIHYLKNGMKKVTHYTEGVLVCCTEYSDAKGERIVAEEYNRYNTMMCGPNPDDAIYIVEVTRRKKKK